MKPQAQTTENRGLALFGYRNDFPGAWPGSGGRSGAEFNCFATYNGTAGDMTARAWNERLIPVTVTFQRRWRLNPQPRYVTIETVVESTKTVLSSTTELAALSAKLGTSLEAEGGFLGTSVKASITAEIESSLSLETKVEKGSADTKRETIPGRTWMVPWVCDEVITYSVDDPVFAHYVLPLGAGYEKNTPVGKIPPTVTNLFVTDFTDAYTLPAPK